EKPKWIAGFSDITLLHLHIQKNYSVSTLHAPMAGAFRDGESGNEHVRSLRDCFLGMPVNYNVDGHPDNRPGIDEGKLIGGNLSLLINSLGTSSEPDTNGAILFLEEVDEYL